jgi:hypothetical protein
MLKRLYPELLKTVHKNRSMYYDNPSLKRFDMAESNRRNFLRHKAEDTLEVLLIPDDIEGSKDSYDLIPAKMVNQSDNGFYIDIDRELQPGLNVRIKMVSPEGYHPEEAHYMRDGRVIRCEKVADATSRFGVGIKILRKVIQARVLTSRFK